METPVLSRNSGGSNSDGGSGEGLEGLHFTGRVQVFPHNVNKEFKDRLKEVPSKDGSQLGSEFRVPLQNVEQRKLSPVVRRHSREVNSKDQVLNTRRDFRLSKGKLHDEFGRDFMRTGEASQTDDTFQEIVRDIAQRAHLGQESSSTTQNPETPSTSALNNSDVAELPPPDSNSLKVNDETTSETDSFQSEYSTRGEASGGCDQEALLVFGSDLPPSHTDIVRSIRSDEDDVAGGEEEEQKISPLGIPEKPKRQRGRQAKVIARYLDSKGRIISNAEALRRGIKSKGIKSKERMEQQEQLERLGELTLQGGEGRDGPAEASSSSSAGLNNGNGDAPPGRLTPEEEACKRRKHVILELIKTERDYVRDLREIVEGYMAIIRDPNSDIALPADLHGGKDKIIFGNMEAIFEWHRDTFSKALERCKEHPEELGGLFQRYERNLHMYVVYSENKPMSEVIVSEHIF